MSLIIYLTGVNEHRTLYLNSLLSTTILSVIFLAFITTGLFKGWKLKDNLGNFYDKFDRIKKVDFSVADTTGLDLGFVEADGIEGCLISILAWIFIAFFGTFILWTFGALFWAVALVMGGLLYWIIFRAFRLIFRNSPKCKGNFLKSLTTALIFTVLYNCWIYAIIFGTHFLNTLK